MQSEIFIFDGVRSSDMGVFNIRTKHSDAEIEVIGKRNVKTNSFGTHQVNYVQDIEKEPIVFNLSISTLDNKWTKEKISNVMSWLIQDDYREFQSGDDLGKIYYVICNKQPTLSVLNGYGCIDISFVANANHGWTKIGNDIYEIDGEKNIIITNKTNTTDLFYYPKLEIIPESSEFSIFNLTDNNREFKLSGLGKEKIIVNNEYAIIESESPTDFYGKYFNKNWFRLVRGDNQIKIKGKGEIKIITQYPIL